MPPETKAPVIPQNLATPIAIVIAGALIALAMYFGGAGSGLPSPSANNNGAETTTVKSVPQVTADDHIIGNQNARIKLVEYTDLECPFCKQFHGTMQQIMDTYEQSGNVAWVLRNFPLTQIHPNAPALALAAECVADVGGNEAYWNFVDEIFRRAPINTFFKMAELDAAVGAVGVNTSQFQSCFDAEKFADRVEKDFNDAVAVGGRGTPFSQFLLSKKLTNAGRSAIENLATQFQPGTLQVSEDGKTIVMSGSLSVETVEAVIEAALN